MSRKLCVVCGSEFDRYGSAITCGKVCSKKRRLETSRLWVAANREANPEHTAENARRYYQANREARVEYNRRYRKANREAIAETRSQYRKANREAIAETSRLWYEANLERVRERGFLWKQANPECRAEYNRLWRKANPEREQVRHQRRRARKRNLPDTLTIEQWQHCLDYFGCCIACGSTENVHADHWIPVSFEGANPGTVAENTIPLCQSCNSSKSNSDASEWLAWKYPKDKALILEAVAFYFESL